MNSKILIKTVLLTGLLLGSATAFAVKLVPGVTDSCEQLWLVNDEFNADADANFGGGECIDVPVNLKKVKVLFNLDNAVIQVKPTAATGGVVTATEINAVGLRHMALLGKVMQYRISQGLIEASNVEIVGIFHGPAMSQKKWPFKKAFGGEAPEVKRWVDKIFALKNAGINIQLEVCGVTLKGMQKTARDVFNKPGWFMMDERAIYSNVDDDGVGPNTTGRILVNQGAVGRIIELQMNGFAYLQEE
jgi:hypothetical protein